MEEQTSDFELVTSEVEVLRKKDRSQSIFSILFPDEDIWSLADSCVRALAKAFGPDPLPEIAANPRQLALHYNSLDVDIPLGKCYHVKNERFWARVVLAKHRDKTLAIRPNVNWRGLGLSLKYVELVEAASAEYWPEEEMKDLALKIEEFVTEMHIKRLKSLNERSFEEYYLPKGSSDEDDESSEEQTESSVPTSEEEEELPQQEGEKTVSQIQLDLQRIEDKENRKIERQMLREEKAKARAEREARHKRREARRIKRDPSLAVKKKKKKNPKSFFSIEISEDDDDEEDKILDWRNKQLYLDHKKNWTYPDEYCHHVDLSFVQYFKHLDTFVIEFLGPLLGINYQKRHLKFSYDDMQRLAQGISQLPALRVFRLRNSLMDAQKLRIIVRALKNLETLEIVDFRFDNLQDDTASSFYELLESSSSIKSLELASNHLGEDVITTIAQTLVKYYKGCLEHLDLSRNPISDDVLHALTSKIKGTDHISSLNLSGIVGLTEKGILCCVVKELLGEHPTLRKLDLTGVSFETEKVVDKVVLALDLNTKILEFGCHGCDIDEESEIDIAILLKRNKYIEQNPHVGDQSITNEELDKWYNRTISPVLLRVFAEREGLTECPTSRFKDFFPEPDPETPTPSIKSEQPSLESLGGISEKDDREDMEDKEEAEDKADKEDKAEMEEKAEKKEIKVKPRPQLFVERPYVDPQANNMYLKNFKQKFEIWNQLKNVSPS